MKTKLKAINSKLNSAGERISDLEDRMMEITQSEKQTERQIKKKKSSIQDLWNNIKHANLCIIGIPEGEEREKRIKKILFEEIMAENVWNQKKEIDIQVEEAQRVPNKMNPNRPTPTHIIIKMTKFKDRGF